MSNFVALGSLTNGHFADTSGNVQTGRNVNVYLRGTVTPVTIYPNADGTGTPLTQPVQTDSNGYVPGYVASLQSIDFYDNISTIRRPGDPISANDSFNAGAAVVTSPGNLGSAQTLNISAISDAWLVGTLNANLALTVGNLVQGGRFKLLLTQDAVGGRTLAINGTNVSIQTAPSTVSIVEGEYDGTNLYVAMLGGQGAPGGDYMPWTIVVPLMTDAYATYSGTNAPQWYADNAAPLYGGLSNGFSFPAINDSVSIDLALGAGIWKFTFGYRKAASYGIITPSLGGTSLGTTFDGYAASASWTTGKITGISVPTSGKQRLSLTITGKNASSTSYTYQVSYITMTRTS